MNCQDLVGMLLNGKSVLPSCVPRLGLVRGLVLPGIVALGLLAGGLPPASAAAPPLSPGRTFVIAAEEVQVDGGFPEKPKVKGIYVRPDGKGGKAAVPVLTREGFPGAVVVACQWTKKLRLLSTKALASAMKADPAHDTPSWLTANQEGIAVLVWLSGKSVTERLAGETRAVPPELASIREEGGTLILGGSHFGTKKPKVWREYVNAKGQIRRQAMKVLPPDVGLLDARGRAAYMDAATGEGRVTLLIPAKPPKGTLNQVLVLDNGSGLAAASLTHRLSYRAGANGSVAGAVEQTVWHGGAGTAVTATPDPGFVFLSWDDGLGGAARQDAAVTADLAVTATFADASQAATLTLAVSPDGAGTTSPAVGGHTVGIDVPTAIAATPGAGKTFSSWTLASGNATVANPAAISTTVTVHDAAGATVRANFADGSPETATLTLAVSPDGAGTTSPAVGGHTVGIDVPTAITATPGAGKTFSSWTLASGNATVANPAAISTTVAVHDAAGATVRANFAADIPAPVAALVASPASGMAPLSVTLDAGGSTGDLVRHEWDYAYDGSFLADADTGATPLSSHVYATAGTHVAAVRVTDALGRTDIATVNLVVSSSFGVELTASIVASAEQGMIPLEVTFDASHSAGAICLHEWDFDYDGIDFSPDPEAGHAVNASHTFSSPGIHRVAVRVSDGIGNHAVSSISISAFGGPPPTVVLSANPAAGHAPLATTITATATGSIVSYEWDWDYDGLDFQADAATGTVNHAATTYPVAKAHNAAVRVTDAHGSVVIAALPIAVLSSGTRNPFVRFGANTYDRAIGSVSTYGGGTRLDSYPTWGDAIVFEDMDFAHGARLCTMSYLAGDVDGEVFELWIDGLPDGGGTLVGSVAAHASGTSQGTMVVQGRHDLYLLVATPGKWIRVVDLVFTPSSTAGLPPTAKIHPSARGGMAPLAVDFSAAESRAPAGSSIRRFEWDLSLDGEGFHADIDTGASPYLLGETFAEGTTTVAVRVTEALGGSAIAAVTLNVVDDTASIIPAARRVDWRRTGVEGGIPDDLPILRTLTAGELAGNAGVPIQAAINAAVAPGVIVLPAGTFSSTTPVYLKSGIVLRGQGMNLTRINVDCRDLVQAYAFQLRGSAAPTEIGIVAGALAGSCELTLTSTAGLRAGDVIDIYQDNDAALMATDKAHGGGWDPGVPIIGQVVRLVNVEGNRVGIHRPLRFDFNPAFSPRCQKVNPIRRAGLEDLRLHHADNDIHDYTLHIKYAENCWVRGVEFSMAAMAHLWLENSLLSTIEANYFHGVWHMEPDYDGTAWFGGYSVLLGRRASDILVTNNVAARGGTGFMFKEGANGCVIAYNYGGERDYYSNTPSGDWSLATDDLCGHGHYPYAVLAEGNALDTATASDYWGPGGPFITLFRNRLLGYRAIRILDRTHQVNLVGNVVPLDPDDSGIFYDREYDPIDIEADCLDPMVEGNLVLGVREWHDLSPQAMEPSLAFPDGPPHFWGNRPWPLIGADVDAAHAYPNYPKIPAEDWWQAISAHGGTGIPFQSIAGGSP